jgi:hypothetical protein
MTTRRRRLTRRDPYVPDSPRKGSVDEFYVLADTYSHADRRQAALHSQRSVRCQVVMTADGTFSGAFRFAHKFTLAEATRRAESCTLFRPDQLHVVRCDVYKAR